jgi:hypothetical protein
MTTNQKHLINPTRRRQVPRSFSWVDHRLVRDNHLAKAPAPAWALYLVLVTVGDEQGLSYYAERTLARLLGLSEEGVAAAREHLLQAGVIAYQAPLYQVLALERPGDPGDGQPTVQPVPEATR